MTNTTIQFNLAGMTIEEATSHIMNTEGVTVPVIEEQLDLNCVDYKKRMLKAEKAELLARNLVANVLRVKETNVMEIKEEALAMELIENTKEMETMNKRLAAPSTTLSDIGLAENVYAQVSPHFVSMVEKSTELAREYMKAVDKFELVVRDITIFPEFKNASPAQVQNKQVQQTQKFKESGVTRRILGSVVVKVPADLLVIKTWDAEAPNSKGGKGKPVHVPFEHFNLDLTTTKYSIFDELDAGHGFLKLAITETISKDGKSSGLKVGLPKERRETQDGTIVFDEIFRTADITRSSNEVNGIVHTQAMNAQLSAQLAAYVQMVTNTFSERNPENHRVFEKYNCAHLVRFNVQAEDDMDNIKEILDRENVDLIAKRNVLYPIPGDVQNQIGDAQPQNFCSMTKEWVDMDGVRTINESYQFRNRTTNTDDRFATDANGNYRQPRADEIINGGRIMKRKDVITDAIEQHCASCAMYCGSSPEFRETPAANAQLIETGFEDERGIQRWVARYPHEIVNEEGIELNGVRVRSGKLTVTGTMDIDFAMIQEVEVEDRDEIKINVSRAFAAMRYGVHRYFALTEEQHDMLVEMDAPEGMTREELIKWNDLVEQYNEKAVEVYEKAVAVESRMAFPQYFFAGSIRDNMDNLENPEEAIEVNIYDVMSEVLKKHDDGFLGFGLGFEGMKGEDIARLLDDEAENVLFEVIEDGREVCITNTIEQEVISMIDSGEFGGARTDEELQHAANGLQAMLQMTLTEKPEFFSDGRYHDASYLAAVQNSEDPMTTVMNMNVTDVVKGYLLQLIK